MVVVDADSARAWLLSWGNAPRLGILREAIDGLSRRASIMSSFPSRYTESERTNAHEAVKVVLDNLQEREG